MARLDPAVTDVRPAPTIRAMEVADIPMVHDIEVEVYPQAWSQNVFHDELARANRAYFVAEIGGAIVGYGGLMLVEEDAHVTTLAVAPAGRRHGVGTRVMLRLVDAALERGSRNLTLEVRVSNEGARRLYGRFGFAPVGMRKDYYRDEDALVMWAIDIDGDEYAQRIASLREMQT